MSLALAAVVAAVAAVIFFVVRSKREKAPAASTESTPDIDRWIAETLENELSLKVLGLRTPSDEEKKPLSRTLSGAEPDADLVAKIESQVRTVEIEYVRLAHETDAQVTLRVRFEDGSTSHTAKRIAWTDVPEGVRSDFERRSSTHVFRTWAFPWQRIRIA